MPYPSRMPEDMKAPLEELAKQLTAPALSLAAVIDFETAETWSPEICNVAMPAPPGGKAHQFSRRYSELSDLERDHIIAIGLIQLTKIGLEAIRRNTGRRYTFADLAAMTGPAQLAGPVRDYLEPFKGRMQDPVDAYMAIFCPAAIGRPLSWPLPYVGKAYSLNRGLDRDKDGKITKQEAGRPILARLAAWKASPPPAPVKSNPGLIRRAPKQHQEPLQEVKEKADG